MEKYNIKVIFDKPNLKVTFENIRAESEEEAIEIAKEYMSDSIFEKNIVTYEIIK